MPTFPKCCSGLVNAATFGSSIQNCPFRQSGRESQAKAPVAFLLKPATDGCTALISARARSAEALHTRRALSITTSSSLGVPALDFVATSILSTGSPKDEIYAKSRYS